MQRRTPSVVGPLGGEVADVDEQRPRLEDDACQAPVRVKDLESRVDLPTAP